MLPGILIFFVGLGLFVLFLLLVVFSFFMFFIPTMHWIFYLDLDVLVASVVLMIVGGIVALAGFSGWKSHDEEIRHPGFIGKRADKDAMRISERIGELFGLVISALILLFFVANQMENTGFFTSSFGPLEQSLFYGAWVFGAVVALVRVAYGKRNAIRPLEVVQAFVWAVSAFWLLAVFPFNFTHLPDLLPQGARFAFFWVNNQVGELLLVLVGIGSLANMAYTSALYFSVGSELKRRGASIEAV
jgi:hypothetical protein